MRMSARSFLWGDLTSEDFRGPDPERCIVILPVAAIEQHAPHLPLLTDTGIADGMVGMLRQMLPDELRPTQSYGKSNEHLLSPGTLTLPAHTLLRIDLGKIVLINSHGGNVDVLGIVARELRVRYGMLFVATRWRRFGLPAGIYGSIEDRHGSHAGDVETSLMLHFRPDLVRMEKAKTFVSNAVAIEQEFTFLRPTGPHGFGWIAQDLNAEGAVGDAVVATAEKGRRTAEHQIEGMIALVRDMTAFALSRLYVADAEALC
jgi:creatinine amidohydrolase